MPQPVTSQPFAIRHINPNSVSLVQSGDGTCIALSILSEDMAQRYQTVWNRAHPSQLAQICPENEQTDEGSRSFTVLLPLQEGSYTEEQARQVATDLREAVKAQLSAPFIMR